MLGGRAPRSNQQHACSPSACGVHTHASRCRTDPDIENPVEDLPFKHWGMYQPTNARDSNGYALAQECGIANMSEAFKGAWGWNDVRCGSKFVYICRRIREWRQGPAAALLGCQGARWPWARR